MDTLETARLWIRPFAIVDLPAAHRLLDVDLRWAGPGVTLAQRRERLAFARALAQRDDTGRLYGYRAITRKPAGDLLGLCGFLPCLWSARRRALLAAGEAPGAAVELEVGYALGTAHRGRGYATEALGH